ncbi:nose resistant to fluoxetine protein 6-like [Haliotis asinina]|uniref:nose resistant to fluoxetine protein 6-like n=1 Tax=Haliotis asinina TaxID=109174 RepID=UPI0035322E33
MKLTDMIVWLYVILCGCGVGGVSDYVSMLTRGLHPLPKPDLCSGVKESMETLRRADIIQVAGIIQDSNVLRPKGGLLTDPRAVGANGNISTKCVDQTAKVLEALMAGEQWALQMIDAAGKPGSRLLQLNLNFLGSYEECVGVKATETIKNVTEPLFNGKYCKASIPLQPNAPDPTPNMPSFTDINIGLCFPDSCSGEDVTLILNDMLDLVLEQLNITTQFRVRRSVCQEENLEWDTKAIAVFVVAMVFVALMVFGTIYDIVVIQLPRWYMLAAEANGLLNGTDTYSSLNIKHKQEETTPLIGEKGKVEFSQPQPSLCGKILLSFSVYTNASKMLSTKQSAGSLTAINGIRFLSMTWVILGHTYVFGLSSVDNFISYFPDVVKRFTFQAIVNATVSVDSFFTLSGLLVTFLVLKEMRRSGGRVNWFMFYFHRFWRLTPPYMLVMMVYVPLFPYISNGPLWPQQGIEINQCRNSWWTNLLYVNNLVNTKEMCMGWSWYLANDMQFYILSPLIFVPLFFSGILGTIAVLVFLLAVFITAGVLSRVHNMSPSMTGGFGAAQGGDDPMAYFFDYYITPYCRMGPYIVGMVTGYLLYKTDCKIKLNKWLVLLGWCVATASALAVLYGLYDVNNGHPVSVEVAAFYNAVHRSVWGACLCWVIFACATGYGGFVNTLLSWSAFVPLGRLTYCAYLVHPIVMYIFFSSQHTLVHLSDINVVIWFLGLLICSNMTAFVVSLAFESPMMGLEKALLKREKSS